MTTEAWTDKTTGDKWTPQRLLAEIVGPSLRWATTRIPREPAPRPPTRSRTTQAARRHDQVRGGRPWRSAPGALSMFPGRGQCLMPDAIGRGAIRGARCRRFLEIMDVVRPVGIGAGRGRYPRVLLNAASSSVWAGRHPGADRVGAPPIALTCTAAKQEALLKQGAAEVLVTESDDVVERCSPLPAAGGAPSSSSMRSRVWRHGPGPCGRRRRPAPGVRSAERRADPISRQRPGYAAAEHAYIHGARDHQRS